MRAIPLNQRRHGQLGLPSHPSIATHSFVSEPGTASGCASLLKKRKSSIPTASEMSTPPSGCQSIRATLPASFGVPSPQGNRAGSPVKSTPRAHTPSPMSTVPSWLQSPRIWGPPGGLGVPDRRLERRKVRGLLRGLLDLPCLRLGCPICSDGSGARPAHRGTRCRRRRRGPPAPSPGSRCGPDRTPDRLSCEVPGSCAVGGP